jgi:ankyrin repeat protein
MFAAWQGHEDAVAVLLEAGADPNIKSGTVPSAFETVGGHPPSSALHEAIRDEHFIIAKALISAGADIDAGAVALAGRSGDVQFLAYLKDRGAEWNVSSGNAFYATPLCAAASSGSLAAVSWLIKNGADPNVVAARQTALKEAVESDEMQIVGFLLDHGANPNLIYGSTEESALFTAVTKHPDDRAYPANLSIIRMLLQHGADQTHRAFDGQHTALDFIKIQKVNTAKYLEKATTEEAKSRIRASLAHMDAVIDLLQNKRGEPDGSSNGG